MVYHLGEEESKELKGNEYIITTIVTSDLLNRIAEKNGVKCYNVLTGFKFFAELMRDLEGKEEIYRRRRRELWLPGR